MTLARIASRQLRLGDVAEIDRRALAPSEIVEGTPFVGLEHITGERGLVAVKPVHAGDLGSPKFSFNPEHVLYGKLRPYLRKVARPSFAGVCSTDILPIRPGPEIDRNFLFHYLRSDAVVELATRRSSGANLPRLSPSALLEFRLRLPPLTEQHRIAAILDKADAIRRKRREQIRLVESLEPSAFLASFEDPAGRRQLWETGRLGKFLCFLTSGSRGWAKYYAATGTPFLRIQNVGANRLLLSDLAHVDPPDDAEAERTAVLAGDVLMSITADLGRTAVIPEGFGRAHINQHLALLRVGGIDPVYLSAFLASPAGTAQITRLNRGGVKAGLNFNDIRSIEIPVPPAERQKEFRAIWEGAKALRSKLDRAFVGVDALFSSLSHSFFGSV